MFSRRRKDNIYYAINSILDLLGKKHTDETINACLSAHPDGLTILGINDCLESFGVSSRVSRANKDQFESGHLSYPFVAHITIPDEHFVTVTRIVDGQVFHIDGTGKSASMSLEHFLYRWDGVRLEVAGYKKGWEKNYWLKKVTGVLDRYKIILFMLLIVSYGVFSIRNEIADISLGVLLFLKNVGIIVTATLVSMSVGAESQLSRKLCLSKGKFDCGSVINSVAGRLNEWLSWSEIGLFYFSGTIIYLFLRPSDVDALLLVNLLALPYTIYSIGYQAIKKKWCVLCCSVQAILWLETFALMSHFGFKLPHLNIDSISSFIFAFAIPVFIWKMLAPGMAASKEIHPLKKSLRAFKFSEGIFESILKMRTRFQVDPEIRPVSFGNIESPNILTIVSNPYCPPCARAHRNIDELLRLKKDLHVQVIFSSGKSETDKRARIAKHLIALSLSDADNAARAFSAWFEDDHKEYEQFTDLFPTDNLHERRGFSISI